MPETMRIGEAPTFLAFGAMGVATLAGGFTDGLRVGVVVCLAACALVVILTFAWGRESAGLRMPAASLIYLLSAAAGIYLFVRLGWLSPNEVLFVRAIPWLGAALTLGLLLIIGTLASALSSGLAWRVRK